MIANERSAPSHQRSGEEYMSVTAESSVIPENCVMRLEVRVKQFRYGVFQFLILPNYEFSKQGALLSLMARTIRLGFLHVVINLWILETIHEISNHLNGKCSYIYTR